MQKVVTSEEMREIDRLTTEKYGIPSILLMENAAHATARVIAEKLGGSVAGKSFLIFCGKGNNGGDGAALARILATQGGRVDVFLTENSQESKGDAKFNFEVLEKLEKPSNDTSEKYRIVQFANSAGNFCLRKINSIEHWQENSSALMEQAVHFDVLVDALFGTGLTRPLENIYKMILDFYNSIFNYKNVSNRQKPLLVSIDIPSGLNADLAQTIGQNVQAELTVTFTAPKLANVLAPASNFNGELVVANIGSPQELIDNSPSKLFLAEKQDARNWIEQTEFSSASYKNARGRALIIAGSKKMAGAAVLAANAAMVSGLGLVRVATPESARDAVASRTAPETLIAGVKETKNGAISYAALEEVLELTEKADVCLIGSGLSSDESSTKKFVREFIEKRKFPVVIDADGLNALAPFDLKGSDKFPLILTPHIGEMRTLLGVDNKADLSDRVKIVREFAEKHRVILVLKGERNLIAAPDGRVVISPTGNSGLGKAGSGDTLAGIITGFLAQAVGMKVDIFETVVAALYIAGLAGDIAAEKIGKRVMTASDVRGCLGAAFQFLEKN
jgi:NAD(P)H-hydrate epimerase